MFQLNVECCCCERTVSLDYVTIGRQTLDDYIMRVLCKIIALKSSKYFWFSEVNELK